MQLAPNQYRHYTPAGEIPDSEPVLCGVCGARCMVKRDRLGPGEPKASVTGILPRCDVWACPLELVPWHVKAVRIAAEAQATASDRLRLMLMEEAAELIARHTKG